jgi:hypothetical protein
MANMAHFPCFGARIARERLIHILPAFIFSLVPSPPDAPFPFFYCLLTTGHCLLFHLVWSTQGDMKRGQVRFLLIAFPSLADPAAAAPIPGPEQPRSFVASFHRHKAPLELPSVARLLVRFRFRAC